MTKGPTIRHGKWKPRPKLVPNENPPTNDDQSDVQREQDEREQLEKERPWF